MEALDELKQKLYLKYRANRHIHALLRQDGANGNIVSKGRGGGKVCTERAAFIFRHFIAVILIVNLGQWTQTSIFVSILVLHLALTWTGRRSRLLCPGGSWHSLVGIGKGGEGGGNG